MADIYTSDGCSNLFDVTLTSELKYMKNIGGQVSDEILQIIIDSLLQYETELIDDNYLDDENCHVFSSTLGLEDWEKNDQCIESLQEQQKTPKEADCSARPKTKKRTKPFNREQIKILEEEFNRCQSPEVHKFDQIADTLKVTRRRVENWFEKHRKNSSSASSSSNGTVKLTLRLKKQSEVTNTWSVLQPNSVNDCFSTTTKSSVPCREEKTTKSATAPKSRVFINFEQVQILEEIFSVNKYVAGKRRRDLADNLNLEERQITRWFEYRRRRMRESQAKLTEDKESDSTVLIQQLDLTNASCTIKEEPLDTIPSRSSSSLSAQNFENSQSSSSGYDSTFSSGTTSSKQSFTFGDTFVRQKSLEINCTIPVVHVSG